MQHIPVQVAFLAFGQRVFKTTEQSATIIKQCVSEARHGKVPEAATKGYTWISAPDCPLPLAYEVDLRIIGSAIIGAAVVAALLRVSVHSLQGHSSCWITLVSGSPADPRLLLCSLYVWQLHIATGN